eukprot:TRINITY_DN4535_c1_g1_i10.p1 TRINITY_DN4535_c1_g1~~TRINITY_DN4535_c1_g1_i10.p1  ORF type:complete len:206 (+),score=23.18 TRINITY_DN4535_c1_g1_i10:116-733(+)
MFWQNFENQGYRCCMCSDCIRGRILKVFSFVYLEYLFSFNSLNESSLFQRDMQMKLVSKGWDFQSALPINKGCSNIQDKTVEQTNNNVDDRDSNVDDINEDLRNPVGCFRGILAIQLEYDAEYVDEEFIGVFTDKGSFVALGNGKWNGRSWGYDKIMFRRGSIIDDQGNVIVSWIGDGDVCWIVENQHWRVVDQARQQLITLDSQ